MRCYRHSRRLRRRSPTPHTALRDCSRAARSTARPQSASARCRRRPRRRRARHLLARSTQSRRAARSTESRLTLVGCEHVDRRARSAFWPCVTATRPGSVNEPQRAREEREGDAPPPASTVWHWAQLQRGARRGGAPSAAAQEQRGGAKVGRRDEVARARKATYRVLKRLAPLAASPASVARWWRGQLVPVRPRSTSANTAGRGEEGAATNRQRKALRGRGWRGQRGRKRCVEALTGDALLSCEVGGVGEREGEEGELTTRQPRPLERSRRPTRSDRFPPSRFPRHTLASLAPNAPGLHSSRSSLSATRSAPPRRTRCTRSRRFCTAFSPRPGSVRQLAATVLRLAHGSRGTPALLRALVVYPSDRTSHRDSDRSRRARSPLALSHTASRARAPSCSTPGSTCLQNSSQTCTSCLSLSLSARPRPPPRAKPGTQEPPR